MRISINLDPMKCTVIWVLWLALFLSNSVVAQDEFANLSAKERIKIAEEENENARADAEFLNLMQMGHEMFKQKHYLKAIRKYEEAQVKRPYNVYPKVIIADIELSMKDTLEVLRAAEKQELRTKKDQVKPKREDSPENNPQSESDRLKKQEDWEKKERDRLKAERELKENQKREPKMTAPAGDVKELTLDDFQKDLAKQYPSGITELISKEGNKTITTRVLVSGEKGDEYKKVVHNWGGIFYFKNGIAVPERVWKQETEK